MISRVYSGSGFRGLLSYLHQPEKEHEYVAGNALGRDAESLVSEMRVAANRNHGVDKVVFHASLSARHDAEGKGLPVDEIDSEKWGRIAEAYVKEMGLENRPWIALRHHDADNDHIHIVASRVDYDGVRYNDHQERRRGMAAARVIERDFDLVRAEDHARPIEITPEQTHQIAKTGDTPPHMQLREAIDSALEKSTDAKSFQRALARRGVAVEQHHGGRGVSYALAREGRDGVKEIHVKSSRLGRRYGAGALGDRGIDVTEFRDALKERVRAAVEKALDAPVRTNLFLDRLAADGIVARSHHGGRGVSYALADGSYKVKASHLGEDFTAAALRGHGIEPADLPAAFEPKPQDRTVVGHLHQQLDAVLESKPRDLAAFAERLRAADVDVVLRRPLEADGSRIEVGYRYRGREVEVGERYSLAAIQSHKVRINNLPPPSGAEREDLTVIAETMPPEPPHEIRTQLRRLDGLQDLGPEVLAGVYRDPEAARKGLVEAWRADPVAARDVLAREPETFGKLAGDRAATEALAKALPLEALEAARERYGRWIGFASTLDEQRLQAPGLEALRERLPALANPREIDGRLHSIEQLRDLRDDLRHVYRQPLATHERLVLAFRRDPAKVATALRERPEAFGDLATSGLLRRESTARDQARNLAPRVESLGSERQKLLVAQDIALAKRELAPRNVHRTARASTKAIRAERLSASVRKRSVRFGRLVGRQLLMAAAKDPDARIAVYALRAIMSPKRIGNLLATDQDARVAVRALEGIAAPKRIAYRAALIAKLAGASTLAGAAVAVATEAAKMAKQSLQSTRGNERD